MWLSWLRYNKAEDIIRRMAPSRIDRYLTYWNSIAPRSDREYYERWLFAYMSVRTTWRENVKLFNAIRLLPAGFTVGQLHDCLIDNRAGMFNTRTKGIWQFHQSFWQDPDSWYLSAGETLTQCRDRLVDRIFGLGTAKVSFVMEMAFPSTCNVICIDTHIGQLYGLKSPNKMTREAYRRIEQHWTKTCEEAKIPAAIARHVYWDQVQAQDSTRYWSHVFECAA